MQNPVKLLSAGLLAGLVILGSGCSVENKTAPSGTLISIAAQGEASQAPDIATLSAGVVTEAIDSKAAMSANAEQMEKLIEAIDKAGIDKKDVQTSGISLSPRYDYTPDRPQKRVLTGYQARNTVNITVRKLDDLSKVIDSLTTAGANQIHGPSFSIGEPEPLLAEAREKALAQARARAESYAKALDTKVLRIVSISEGSHGGMPRGMVHMEAAMVAKDAASTPVALGESTVSVNLELVFELKK